MSKTAFIRARVQPALKNQAENMLQILGITPTQAIVMLYQRIVRDREWPLELKIPNAETQKTFEETDRGEGLVKCKEVDDLFNRLGVKRAKNKFQKKLCQRRQTDGETR